MNDPRISRLPAPLVDELVETVLGPGFRIEGDPVGTLRLRAICRSFRATRREELLAARLQSAGYLQFGPCYWELAEDRQYWIDTRWAEAEIDGFIESHAAAIRAKRKAPALEEDGRR